MNAQTPLEISHDEAGHQFFCVVDGHRCVIDYSLAGSIMTITHTGVPDAVGGRGIAAQLTRAAFDAARERGWKVRPACSYAASYAQRHPEVADLLA